jgi:hypothetical protein
MTKLEQIIKRAKQIRLAQPKKFAKWTDYVKYASKDLADKVVGKKKTVGKANLLPFPKEKKQTGKTNIAIDRRKQAMAPGKRKASPAAKKPFYYESRANRSDKGKLLGFFDVTAIKDLDGLKKQYQKLAKKYHPDAGGTTSQFQDLQNEYEKLRNSILRGSNLNKEQQQNEIQIDDAIRKVIDALISLENINVELIGKWLWVSGNTYPVKDALKSAGLVFIKKDGVPYWVYKGVESSSRGGTSIEEIKAKYGVHKMDLKPSKKLSGIKKPVNKTKLKLQLKKLMFHLNKRPI